MKEYLRILNEFELTCRRSRLLCVAVCRAVWENIESEVLREVVSIGEAFADGLVHDEHRARAMVGCPHPNDDSFVGQGQLVMNCVFPTGFVQHFVCLELAVNIGWLSPEKAADIASCFVPSLLTSLPLSDDVAKMAKLVYFRRNEDYTLDHVAMCVLADMVEEEMGGGVITQHLRENKPRYRGDWVVDLLMRSKPEEGAARIQTK